MHKYAFLWLCQVDPILAQVVDACEGSRSAYSLDFGMLVLADCDAGLGTAEIAAKCQVIKSWVRRLKQRRRETGRVARLRRSGGRPTKIAGTREKRLRELIKKHLDATLDERSRRLRLQCCVSTVHLVVIGLGMSYKKVTACQRTTAPRREAQAGSVPAHDAAGHSRPLDLPRGK